MRLLPFRTLRAAGRPAAQTDDDLAQCRKVAMQESDGERRMDPFKEARVEQNCMRRMGYTLKNSCRWRLERAFARSMSVNELHSLFGLLFSCLLFMVFLTGTLTVFDSEITYWMQQPEYLRVSSRAGDVGKASSPETELASKAKHGNSNAPTDRLPLLMVKLQDYRTFGGQTIDPNTGDMVTFRDTRGGDLFYHFHHGLLLGFPGAWIVGTAGIAMFIALVTGLGIYRRSLLDIFVSPLRSFRQRAWLGAHTLTGVFMLPFHLMITSTGLMIFWSIYMPTNMQLLSAGDWGFALLSDLHFAQLGGATMRWLYFLMGLAACAMIATGLVLWSNKRRKYHAERSGLTHYRFIEALNVAAVAGLMVAIGTYFWVNRILPLGLIDRSLWETRCFFVLWCCCLAHSLLRVESIFAWRDQLYTAAFLFGLLPLLNGLMTNSHLVVSLPKGQWELAGFDLTALAAGLLLGWTARRIGKAEEELQAAGLSP